MRRSNDSIRAQTIGGVLLGTALGDSLGLPTEGLTAGRIQSLGPGGLKHRFLFGRGMCSDDTEHTLMVARALLDGRGDSRRFGTSLGWKFRWWLLMIPAGVGLATARAIVRLWFGIGFRRSGVWSAGNGPAMRCGVIGAVYGGDSLQRCELTTVATEITHRDPRALVGALAITECVALCSDLPATAMPDETRVLEMLRALAPDDAEWQSLINQITDGLEKTVGTGEFALSLGCDRGVTGFAYRSVPVAIYSWLRNGGRFCAIEEVIRCGGDTDTVGAITGTLVGATLKRDGLPKGLTNGLWEWPAGVTYMDKLASALADLSFGRATKKPRWAWPMVPFRNLIFLATVLIHGLLRLVPGGMHFLLGSKHEGEPAKWEESR